MERADGFFRCDGVCGGRLAPDGRAVGLRTGLGVLPGVTGGRETDLRISFGVDGTRGEAVGDVVRASERFTGFLTSFGVATPPSGRGLREVL